MKIKTYKTEVDGSKTGVCNGYLIPVWSKIEQPDLAPEQVYVTAVAPYSRKGPHLHFSRRGVFCCVSGDVVVAVADVKEVKRRVKLTEEEIELEIQSAPSSPPPVYKEVVEYHADMSTVKLYASTSAASSSSQQKQVIVDPGKAAAIYNDEGKEALVLNLPSPAWSKDAPDDWVVVGWQDPPIGQRQKAAGE